MRDVQLQRPPEQGQDRGVEVSAGEELEARAEGAVSDEDPDELAHHGFGVFHEFGEPAAHLRQGRQRELRPDPAPDARSVARELDDSDALDDTVVPGGEIVAEELVVQVIPQAEDEFTCYSCFLVRHRSQIARQKDGHSYCVDCEG